MTKAIPNFKLFLLLLFISLVIMGLNFTPFLDFPKKIASYITNPISFGLYNSYQGVRSQLYFVFASRFVARENKTLKEQLGTLLFENTTLKKRLSEVQSQLEQFEFISPTTYNLVPARPVGLGRFLKIDKGSGDGIRVGQAVMFKDNFVGRIKETSLKSSTVLLMQDPDSKIASFTQGGGGRAKGVVVGQFGTESLMDKILHEEIIEIGDMVYSEGTEGFLPRGLILGKVSEVLERKNEVFKQAKVKPVFDIRDLELVFVIVE